MKIYHVATFWTPRRSCSGRMVIPRPSAIEAFTSERPINHHEMEREGCVVYTIQAVNWRAAQDRARAMRVDDETPRRENHERA